MNAVVSPLQCAYTSTSLLCAGFGNYVAEQRPWHTKIVERPPPPRHFCHERGAWRTPRCNPFRGVFASLARHTRYGIFLAIHLTECFITSLPPAQEDPAGHRPPTTPVAGPFFRTPAKNPGGRHGPQGLCLSGRYRLNCCRLSPDGGDKAPKVGPRPGQPRGLNPEEGL